MGLIRAAFGAAGSVLADQWKELFYTESLDKETLMVKGSKRVSGRSSNTKGSDNVITKGSGIVVNDGQCAIIVDQGEIAEVVSEPGYFTYDNSTEPTIFCGNLGQGIKDSFKTFAKRFTFGADTGKDQRIYFFNIKEMVDNKFGTPNPIPFRVVDKNIGLDIDVSVRCSGTYSFKMADPILFYKNLAGNVRDVYRIDELDTQLKTEFVSALQPAIGKLSDLEIRPSSIPNHVEELTAYLNEQLSTKWLKLRGFEVVSVALNPVTLPEEDQKTLKEMQKAGALRDTNMAAATIAAAQADAMRAAASNESGAMNGFVGMGFAQNAGSNAANLFAMGQQNHADSAAGFCFKCGAPLPSGAMFCPKCGQKLG